jgi:hypothetical protein
MESLKLEEPRSLMEREGGLSMFMLRLSAFLFVLVGVAQARWAERSDFATEIEFYHKNLTIYKDGSFEEEVEIQTALLRESGKESLVQTRFYYTEDDSTFQILEAYTLTPKGEKIPIPRDRIEDNTQASFGYGFDSQRQVLISFTNLEVGAKTYVRYLQKKQKPDLQGVFNQVLGWGWSELVQTSTLNIQSAIPLFYKMNDPIQALEMKIQKSSQSQAFLEATITQKKPVIRGLRDEPGTLSLDQLVWISLSSLRDWKELGQKKSVDFSPQTLTEPFLGIAKEAKALLGSEEDRINFVASKLIQSIQFMGDWRSISGRLIPRSLEDIGKTQVGDCKDYSIVSTAIFRYLGFEAYPALVERYGQNNRDERSQVALFLPSLYAFNHAITKIVSPVSKKTYWFDGTNRFSRAGLVFSDLNGADALVLASDQSGIEKLPKVDPWEKVLMETEETIHLGKQGKTHHRIQVSLKDQPAQQYSYNYFNMSAQEFEEYLYRWAGGSGIPIKNRKKVDYLKPDSETLQDIKGAIEFELDHYFTKTNLGLGMGASVRFEHLNDWSGEDVGDFLFHGPWNQKQVIRVHLDQPLTGQGFQRFNVKIQTPWCSIERKIKLLDSKTLEVTIQLATKSATLTHRETQGKEFQNLRSIYRDQLQNFMLILK